MFVSFSLSLALQIQLKLGDCLALDWSYVLWLATCTYLQYKRMRSNAIKLAAHRCSALLPYWIKIYYMWQCIKRWIYLVYLDLKIIVCFQNWSWFLYFFGCVLYFFKKNFLSWCIIIILFIKIKGCCNIFGFLSFVDVFFFLIYTFYF
jgi:hypothetical protein